MKTLKYMVLCMTVLSCAPAFGTRQVTTEPTNDVAAIAKILEDSGVTGGEIMPQKVVSNYVGVFCGKDGWSGGKHFKSVAQIIAMLPRLVSPFFLSWSWLKSWVSAPQYQVELVFKNPWYRKMLWLKEKVSYFYIQCDDFKPAGTVVTNN